MEEKVKLKEAVSQMDEWYNEDIANRAYICILKDEKTGLKGNTRAGTRFNLLSLICEIAMEDEYIRKLIEAVPELITELKEPSIFKRRRGR